MSQLKQNTRTKKTKKANEEPVKKEVEIEVIDDEGQGDEGQGDEGEYISIDNNTNLNGDEGDDDGDGDEGDGDGDGDEGDGDEGDGDEGEGNETDNDVSDDDDIGNIEDDNADIGEEDDDENEIGEENDDDDEHISNKKKKPTNKKNKRSVAIVTGIEMLKTSNNSSNSVNVDIDDSDDDDDDDENYLQKFDSELRDNFILNHHPEAKTHNYEEVKALTRVTRDNRGIIIDPLHKTIPIMSKYEMTRILGQRAKQLDSGAKAFVKVPLNVIDGYNIAMLELEQKKIPFIIKRPLPNGGVEYWNVNDLELLI